MPYNRTDELPASVREAIPSTDGKTMFMEVVNSQLDEGKSETVAFASAWSAISRAGYEKNSAGQYIKKREINDDAFTLEYEAQARSQELGMGGDIHVHEDADGMKVYMPGESHEQYLENSGLGRAVSQETRDVLDNEQKPGGLLHSAISAIIETVMNKRQEKADIVKLDDEQKIVYGWASVSTDNGELVVDRQGDIIEPADMEKMATEFMMSARTAKAMHQGDGIGEVIHSMPLTKAIAESFGIKTNREGWVIAVKVHNDEVWKDFKSGKLSMFSVGGQAVREDYEDG